MATLSMSWGISTLISRYSRYATTAHVSRILTPRSRPPLIFGSCPLLSRFSPLRIKPSIQLTMGASR